MYVNMDVYLCRYVRIMRLFVLYDYVQCCEDAVGVELRYMNYYHNYHRHHYYYRYYYLHYHNTFHRGRDSSDGSALGSLSCVMQRP